MIEVEIATLTDGTTAYDQRTELDGEEWLLTFRWNARLERWFMSIVAVADGTPVLTGAQIGLSVELNRRAVGGPPGAFIAVSEDANDDPPGLLDLGNRVKLLYIEAAEVEAL